MGHRASHRLSALRNTGEAILVPAARLNGLSFERALGVVGDTGRVDDLSPDRGSHLRSIARGDRGLVAGRVERVLESGYRRRSVWVQCTIGDGGGVAAGEIAG